MAVEVQRAIVMANRSFFIGSVFYLKNVQSYEFVLSYAARVLFFL